VTALGALLLLAAERSTPGQRADSIVLERTTCFGICPAYRLSIARSGRVILTPLPGSRGMRAMVAGTDSLPPRVFTRLLSLADSAGFFALPDSTLGHPALCTRVHTDAPSIIVSVYAAATGLKRVNHYMGCEGGGDSTSAARLRRLEAFAAEIDREAGTSRWRSPP